MLKLTLAITIVVIMAKMGIWAILALAIGVIKMAIQQELWSQKIPFSQWGSRHLKTHKKGQRSTN